MKKLLTVAALSFVLAGFAEDQYFYWMVADDATLAGEKLSDSQQYYAMIKDGSGYLNLYSRPGATSTDQGFTFAGGDSLKVYAGLESTAQSFIVELYADGGERELLGRADVPSSAIAGYIWAGGMSTPPDKAYEVAAFYAIPEPTSGMLLLLGIAGLALKRKRA